MCIEHKAVQMTELKQQLKQEVHSAPAEQSPVIRPIAPYLNPSDQTAAEDCFDDADGEKGSVMQAKACRIHSCPSLCVSLCLLGASLTVGFPHCSVRLPLSATLSSF